MIAPARLAAYRTLLAVARGTADLADALARERTDTGRRPRSRACGRDRGRHAPLAGAVRSRHCRVCRSAGRAARPRSAHDSADERLPAACTSIASLRRQWWTTRVELARKAGKSSAAGFVNALLRRISRERDRLPASSAATRTCRSRPRPRLSRDHAVSSSTGWSARWFDRYGYEATLAWAEFNNAPAAADVRANTLKIGREALARDLAEPRCRDGSNALSPATA